MNSNNNLTNLVHGNSGVSRQPNADRHNDRLDRDEIIREELNMDQQIIEAPNINRPAVDEPKIGDHDLVHHDINEDEPSRQMQGETFDDGEAAAASFHRETRKEEHKIKRETGGQLPKGEERFEERSISSDGKSAGEKQL